MAPSQPLPDPDPDPGPRTGLLVIAGPILNADDVGRLCERLRAVIASSDARVIACDVGALPATARTVEALARLQLTARRLDRRIRLRRASPALQQLIAFTGLGDVVPTA